MQIDVFFKDGPLGGKLAKAEINDLTLCGNTLLVMSDRGRLPYRVIDSPLNRALLGHEDVRATAALALEYEQTPTEQSAEV